MKKFLLQKGVLKKRQGSNLSLFSIYRTDKTNEKKVYRTTKSITELSGTNLKEKDKLIEEEKSRKKAKRNRLLNILSLVVNIIILGIILGVSLSKDDPSKVYAPKIEWKYMITVIIIVIVLIAIDTVKFAILIRSSTKKSRPFLAYKTSALGKYYDAITPMSTGGQPFQMLYMNKRGIRGDIATSIPLMKYIFWQISYVVICLFAMIYNGIHFAGATNTVMTIAAWISISINIISFSGIILLSLSKKIGPRIVIAVLKFLSKIHIVKNYRIKFRKVMRFVINYQKTFRFFASNFFVLISEFVLSFLDTIIYNFIPYFIYKAFVPLGTMEFFEVFIKSIICNLSLGFIPTPGASGGAEGVFLLIFGGSFSSAGQFWPVLIWRISTYYIYLVQGLFVLIYDFFIGNKKADRLKKEGAEIYNPKSTFNQSLKTNLEYIEVVSVQEEDKIPIQVFTAPLAPDETIDDSNSIIPYGDIVSKNEMQERVYPAEQVLQSVRIKDIQKRKMKQAKKQIKSAKKNNKKIINEKS